MIGEIEIASGSSPTSSSGAGSSGLETLAGNQCERNYRSLYFTVHYKYILSLVSKWQNKANGTAVGKSAAVVWPSHHRMYAAKVRCEFTKFIVLTNSPNSHGTASIGS